MGYIVISPHVHNLFLGPPVLDNFRNRKKETLVGSVNSVNSQVLTSDSKKMMLMLI